jgi:hypothetical protein
VEGFPVLFPQERTPLGRWTGSGGRILAGLSSFGFGGTNAHVILEEGEALDPDGNSLVGLAPKREEIYDLKAFPWSIPESGKSASAVLYEVEWEADVKAGPALAGPLLLLDMPRDVKLPESGGAELVLVPHKAGASYNGSRVTSAVDLENVNSIVQLLTSRRSATVVFGGLLGAPTGQGRLLNLVQALLKVDKELRPARVLVLTQGTQGVEGGPRTEVEARQGWVSGFVKTVHVEHAELGLQHVDLQAEGSSLGNVLASVVSGAVSLSLMDVEQVVREKTVYVPRLVESVVKPSGTAKASVRADATYLITGGFGALGLVFAARLIEEGARNVVLLSRSGASTDSAQAALQQLQATGARVEAIKCDVSDSKSVRAMLSSVSKSWPPVRGVLHSAGVLDDATIENQSLERFERVFSPKVRVAL